MMKKTITTTVNLERYKKYVQENQGVVTNNE